MARHFPPIFLAAAALALLAACSTNPATGDRSFTLLSWSQEAQLGAEAAGDFTQQYGGEVPDPEIRAYVTEVGQRLLGGVEEGVPALEWEFTMLDSDVINAFALPGGKVFFSRGLAEQLDDEAEMAGVLGHEIGHVTARHGNQRMSQQLGLNLLLAGLAAGVGVATDEGSAARDVAAVGLPALAVGGNVVMLSYGRDDELEADRLGMRYMMRAGYDPAAQRDVMIVLQAVSGGSSQPEWLSTHPASETRIRRINQLLEGPFAETQENPQYVRLSDEYRTRMLRPLGDLPRPAHGAANVADGQGTSLGPAVLWCAHCREEALAAKR